jgi:uncharacterized protein YegJ (DUF2314 family)
LTARRGVLTVHRLLLALALAAILPNAPAGGQQDRVIPVPNADLEMRAAIAKARASLPQFWEALAHPRPGETRFALKVAVKEGKHTEHLWLNQIVRFDDGRIVGTVADTPEHVSIVRLGQRYKFTADNISDWMFRRYGKIVGNETMRVLLKYMPAQEAAQFRAMLEQP